jgi:ankyrin repeat protein
MEVSKPTLSLHEAAEKGNLEQVKAHLAQGVDINGLDRDKMAALHYAAFNGHKDLMEFLLENGAGLDVKGQEGGVTALHLAATRGHRDIVKFLIEKGATLHAKDHYGRTPIHYAKSFNQTKIMELLLFYDKK